MLVADPDEEVDQRGLFSVAFPPDYRRSRRFYVDYVDRSGHQRIDELRRGSRRVRHVLDLGPVTTQHHGGQLQFGPDGLLYASTGTGDGTRPGTILRFDPRRPRPEVYATGLRNPWRFSFHRGALLIGDVGDHTAEEVDVVPAGAAPGTDFGWPAVEGPGRAGAARARPPPRRRLVRDHRRLRAARPLRLRRPLLGQAVERPLQRQHAHRRPPARRTVPYLVSFGRDARGRVYAVSFGGRVYRLTR